MSTDSPIDLVKYGVLWQKVEDYEKKLVSMADKSRGGFWVGMMVVSGLSSFVGFVSHYVTLK